DARVQDARVQDARVQDARVQDARVQDASVQDARVQDARVQDASVQDASFLGSSFVMNSEAAITMIPWAWRLLPRNVTHSLSTSSTNQRAEAHHRQLEAYGYFLPIQTRWQDNDQYGHVNNAVYYGYFDTIINHYLIRKKTSSSMQVTGRSSLRRLLQRMMKHSCIAEWKRVWDDGVETSDCVNETDMIQFLIIENNPVTAWTLGWLNSTSLVRSPWFG
ncbi:hypothetical protein STEG23_033069, partial [Scotinomys teguina]